MRWSSCSRMRPLAHLIKKDIDERTVSLQSPMPAGLVRTPRELRDLVAYLMSESPTPP